MERKRVVYITYIGSYFSMENIKIVFFILKYGSLLRVPVNATGYTTLKTIKLFDLFETNLSGSLCLVSMNIKNTFHNNQKPILFNLKSLIRKLI